MRAKDMRDRNGEELSKLFEDTKTSLFQLRLKNATHQLENTSEIKKNRREIARILTIMNERSGKNTTADVKDEG